MNNMKSLFVFTGLITVAMIFWATMGYMMDLPSLKYSFPLSIISIIFLLGTGLLKNLAEKRKFEAFLESKKRDKELQQKLKNEKVEPGDKTGRAKVKTYYKDRNVGVSWTGASVHGAVPKRNKRRSFLPKNR